MPDRSANRKIAPSRDRPVGEPLTNGAPMTSQTGTNMEVQTQPAKRADPDLLCSTTIPTEPANLGKLTVIDPEPEWRPTPDTPFELAWYDAKDRAAEWQKIEARSQDALYRVLAECFVMYRIARTDAEALARLNQLLDNPEMVIKMGRPSGDEVAAKVIGLIFGRIAGPRRGQEWRKSEVLRQAQYRHSRWALVLVSLYNSGAVTAEDARYLLNQQGVEALRRAHSTGIQKDPGEDEDHAELPSITHDEGQSEPGEENTSQAEPIMSQPVTSNRKPKDVDPWRNVFPEAVRIGDFCMRSKIRPKGRHLIANWNGKAVTLHSSNADHVAMVRQWLGDKPEGE